MISTPLALALSAIARAGSTPILMPRGRVNLPVPAPTSRPIPAEGMSDLKARISELYAAWCSSYHSSYSAACSSKISICIMLLSRLSRQNGSPVLWIRRAFCPGPVFNGDSLSTGVAVVLPRHSFVARIPACIPQKMGAGAFRAFTPLLFPGAARASFSLCWHGRQP